VCDNSLSQLRVHHWNNATSLGFISQDVLEQIRPTAGGTVSRNTWSSIKSNPTENEVEAWYTDRQKQD
jgi:hypothetical protein